MAPNVHPLSGFIKHIEEIQGDLNPGSGFLYRGHSTIIDGPCLPGIFRTELRNEECRCIREFISSFPRKFDKDISTLEKLVRAQHFSVPTRLLDLTSNPLVALYFACSAGSEVDGEIYFYKYERKMMRYYDSPDVAVLSNISLLNSNEQMHLYYYARNAISNTINLEEFNNSHGVARLNQFVRSDIPNSADWISPVALYNPLFVKPKLNNKRIVAQSGVFLLYGHQDPQIEWQSNNVIQTLTIPQEQKAPLLKALSTVNIHINSLFPEMQNAWPYIHSQL